MKMLLKRGTGLRDEAGAAMVIVVGSMVVLMVLVLGVLAYTMQSEKYSRYDQDYTAAMTAAQSGVDDYISRVNRADSYHMSVDCDNVALKGPRTGANSCGWNNTTEAGWLPVTPGADTGSAPSFHYEVDNSRVYTEGTLNLTVTGRSKDVYRSIEVAVGKGGSTDFVYYTDFESGDPANKVSYPNGAPHNACGKSGNSLARYFYNGRSGKGCSEIQFAGADVLDGRVFSNDAILSKGGTFEMGIESPYPGCNNVDSEWNNCLRSGSNSTTFGARPKFSEPLYLPDNSAEFEGHPGCHYSGATRIVFNPGGSMTVWSQDSALPGAVTGIAPPGGSAPDCGSSSALASAAGATVAVPSDMVVHVGASPTEVPRRQLYAKEIGGPAGRQLPLGAFNSNIPGNPGRYSPSYTADVNMVDSLKYKGEGNVYVEGVVQGRVTIAAAQSIIVTGDLVLQNGFTGADMFGLVATNSVEVMHPRFATFKPSKIGNKYEYRQSGGTSAVSGWPTRISQPGLGPVPIKGVQIAGSIQTLQHSFFVQRFNEGSGRIGELRVTGSIAQRWRGAVATTSPTGYDKLYRYDQRLKFSAPPYFPHWANSEWSLRYSGEKQTPPDVKS